MPQWQMFDRGERRRLERAKHQRKGWCVAYITAQVALELRPPAWFFVCRESGCEEKADNYHHTDYRLPDFVTPLCARHHNLWHRRQPPTWEWLIEKQNWEKE